MYSSPLHSSSYSPQFSGHETFPLRYGWLKKAFDAVNDCDDPEESAKIFQDDGAIARFGVGKNMVAAIRHWANVCGIIEAGEKSGQVLTAPLGQMLFDNSGFDPYMENPSTTWLIHWHLASYERKTTWFWVFNHFSSPTFDRDHLVKGLERLAFERSWSNVAKATIKRDVECFIRTYAARPITLKQSHEDALESPLTELSLIKAVGLRDGFRLIRGSKSSLGDGVFAYSVFDFWRRFSKSNTLSFEALAHQPGSPGKVFQLHEDDLALRLSEIDEVTAGALRWSETAGLRQLVRSQELTIENAYRFIELDYSTKRKDEVV